ncbi:MAG: rod-binding protein [Verrucomicrobia bacterium]|nr:rod-binding protein [Verrucomicrobiota bacterium]
MDVRPKTEINRTQAVPLEQLADNKSLSKSEKLEEVSRQFEAVLLRQILGSARKTVFKSKVNEDSLSSGIYQDMVTSQLADSISQSGSFGLARSLQSQLQHQLKADAPKPDKS